ncbi:cupin domain-containing protein [Nonomuraea rubra]
MLRSTASAGTASPVHVHEDEAEIVVLLSGSGIFWAGDHRYELSEGGVAFLPRKVPHAYRLTSPTVDMLAVSTPPAWGLLPRRRLGPVQAQAGRLSDRPGRPGSRDEACQGFLHAHDHIWREIEAGLAPLNVSMAEYSVLSLLARAGGAGMRMSEPAKRRMMSTGGFTRLADRLESRGLIERRRAAEDGRGYVAVLTAEGRTLLRKAWRQQHAGLRRLFLDRLDEQDLRDLARIWSRLAPDSGDAADDGGRRSTRGR